MLNKDYSLGDYCSLVEVKEHHHLSMYILSYFGDLHSIVPQHLNSQLLLYTPNLWVKLVLESFPLVSWSNLLKLHHCKSKVCPPWKTRYILACSKPTFYPFLPHRRTHTNLVQGTQRKVRPEAQLIYDIDCPKSIIQTLPKMLNLPSVSHM